MDIMKRVFVCIAWLLLLLLSLRQSLPADQEDVDDVFINHSPINSLLPITTPPKKYSTALVVAALDGTIYLVDSNSRKILWSFTSGMPIYSSYQALPDRETDDNDQASELSDFYINIGDDWELYAHSPGYEEVVR